MLQALQAGELHVYYARSETPIGADREARCLAMLSPAERDQQARFRFEQDRRSYLTAHALTRSVLARLLGVEPSELGFELGAHGRPELAAPSRQPPLRFNLSHTRGLVACAVALEADVGVDVEHLERSVEIDSLAARVFSDAERAGLAKLTGAAKRRRFFELWTLKEAYIKAVGVGLSLPLQEISLELGQPQPSLLFGAAIEDDPARWFLAARPIGAYALAAAVAIPVPTRVEVRELGVEDL
jgi:4'-phosphopantetheinyl transferase